MIYHVVPAQRWQDALARGFYEADSLATEGFIHTSSEQQVAGVLERYYKGQTGLLLLHIDETLLAAELRYELAPSVQQVFPHIYGRLNTNAVVETTLI